MTKIEYALEHPASVKDDTVFSEVTYYLLHSIEAAEGLEKLKLTARLEEIKCHYYSYLADSIDFKKKYLKESYVKDAHSAFERLMCIYKELPDED